MKDGDLSGGVCEPGVQREGVLQSLERQIEVFGLMAVVETRSGSTCPRAGRVPLLSSPSDQRAAVTDDAAGLSFSPNASPRPDAPARDSCPRSPSYSPSPDRMCPLRGSTSCTFEHEVLGIGGRDRRDDARRRRGTDRQSRREIAMNLLELEARRRDLRVQPFDLAELRRQRAWNRIGQKAELLRAKHLRGQRNDAQRRRRRESLVRPDQPIASRQRLPRRR